MVMGKMNKIQGGSYMEENYGMVKARKEADKTKADRLEGYLQRKLFKFRI